MKNISQERRNAGTMQGINFLPAFLLSLAISLASAHAQSTYTRIPSLPVQTSPDSTYSIPAADGSGVTWRIPFNYFGTAASDTAFASSWNAVTTISPSKNAIYDYAHLFDTDDDGKVNVLDLAAGIVQTNSSGVVSLVTIGSGLSFTGGTLDLASGAGLPSMTGNTGKYLTTDGSSASWGAFTGTFASLTSKPTTISGYGITDAQPLDPDLTSLAAASSTNALYYRTAVSSSWAAVTIGNGLSFSAPTLSLGSTAITGQTEDTTPASGDFLLTYDISASALKKVTLANLASALTITGVTDISSGFTATFDTTALTANRQFKFANGTSVSVLPASGTSSAPFATGIDSGGNLTFGSTVTTQSLTDADQTITAGTTFAYIPTLTGPHTKTLPTATGYATGATIQIVDASGNCSSTNVITIAPNGSELINGANTSITLSLAWGSTTLRKVANTSWQVIPTATTTGQALSQATSISNARSLLALGTASVQNTGTSGGTLPFLSTSNTWSAGQTQHFGANNLVAPINIGSSTADPPTVFGGDIWFRSDVPALKYYDGTAARTILNSLNISDTAYSSAYNGVAGTAPSQNAIYDYNHLGDTDDDGKIDVLDQVLGVPFTNSSGVLQTPVITPIIVSASAVSVLTSGSPADIATITIPAWMTRWRLISAGANFAQPVTFTSTMAAASFSAFTTTAGGGTQMTAAFNGPATGTAGVQINANNLSNSATSSTLVIRQLVDSANSGTVTFSFTLYPVL